MSLESQVRAVCGVNPDCSWGVLCAVRELLLLQRFETEQIVLNFEFPTTQDISFGNTYTGINERFVLETCGFVRLIKALVKATRMSLPAQLRVIIEQHDVRKLTLTSGIPDSVEELLSVIMERFQLQGNFGLMYQDKDFGKDFFTMTTTADVKDKDTVKLVQIEPTVILNLTTVDESEVDISSVQSDQSITPVSGDHYSADDSGSCSSRDTVLLPATCRSEPWPAKFKIPKFSHDVEMILQEANTAYHAQGTLFQNPSVKSDINQALADAIFYYTAYPTSLQILQVVEALLEKFPCLKEPGSFSGLYGWQQSLKYKMHNYRAKLRSRKLSFPEIDVNALKRKRASDRASAKNVKKPKRAEVNYLPAHPVGESGESLEKLRLDLLSEVKKKNNEKLIAEKMSKTFSSRRLEVVSSSPAVQDVKERWPALFSEAQIKDEFRRITTIRLEETFMSKLDGYTPRLLELMRAKGGVAGTKLRPILDAINQSLGIERKRDMVIQSLIEYLGESREELFHDCQEHDREGQAQHIMKILVVHGAPEEDPSDVAIVIEGYQAGQGVFSQMPDDVIYQ
ncbi:hypothetical protein MHYP_G00193120 [Metynnis hypsauchen]